MPDIQCPMCSKPNDEGAEVCAHCGARLTPLILDSDADERTEEAFDASAIRDRLSPAEESEEEQLPDWLGRIRAEADAEREEQPVEDVPEAEEDQPDWLGRLREVDMSEGEGPPEGEVPDWVTELGEESIEPEAPVEEEPGEGDEEEVPDWLQRIREREAQEPEPTPEAEEVEEDWLQRLRTEDQAPPGIEEIEEPPEEPMVPPAPEEAEELDAGRLEELFGESDSAEWRALDLASIMEEAEELVPEATGEPSPDLEEPSWTSEAEAPEELFEALGEEGFEDEAPSEIEEIRMGAEPPEPEREGDLPHVQALIIDEEEAEADVDSSELDLDAIDLPDWLTDLEGGREAPKPPEPGREPDLAPATLPAWLEAMRPIETFRSSVEIESAEEQIVESAGPLAGLRGVLVAEPVVAMPRTGGVGTARLEVTERQYAQSELLHRMVEEDARERFAAEETRPGLPLLRWLISAFLVLAVAVPVLFPGFAGGFDLPSLVPQDLAPLVTKVERVPPDRPVLVVFDYNPGFSGELDAVAGALMRHVLGRGLRVASVSTLPTGPPLAENLLSRYGANGVNYMHLGYLSGGPTAVQVFAAAPREAIPRGFLPPEEAGQEIRSGWEHPMLQSVGRLADFGMVVVITAGTENARTWAEQATPWMGDTPLVMVLSAGAEPLVRPYYEALDPQVDGILTGIPAAVAYEQLNAAPGDAQSRWDAFGMGMFAATLLLLAGSVVGVVNWLLSPDAE
jgi:hypothetical protein